jgi:hypothetical protein
LIQQIQEKYDRAVNKKPEVKQNQLNDRNPDSTAYREGNNRQTRQSKQSRKI